MGIFVVRYMAKSHEQLDYQCTRDEHMPQMTVWIPPLVAIGGRVACFDHNTGFVYFYSISKRPSVRGPSFPAYTSYIVSFQADEQSVLWVLIIGGSDCKMVPPPF